MTLARSSPAVNRRPLPRPDRWHRPLIGLALGMTVLALACLVLAVTDPREILGQNAWFKPLKFALSIGIYSVSLAWLIGQAHRLRRLADGLGTVIVIALLVEMVIIAGAAAFGTTSHFNVATPLHAALWSAMGVSIVLVWVASLAVGVVVVLNPGPDAARNLAVRAAVVLALIGMGLAFLMTTPNDQQLADFQGVAGAHAVGVADGGAGLPFLGWSTQGGDLRIPHFLGMHALQAIPLGLLGLELLSRGAPVLRGVRVRFRLVLIGSVAFAAMITVLAWQALSGESIVHPSGPVLAAGAVIALGTAAAAIAVLLIERRSLRSRARSGPGL